MRRFTTKRKAIIGLCTVLSLSICVLALAGCGKAEDEKDKDKETTTEVIDIVEDENGNIEDVEVEDESTSSFKSYHREEVEVDDVKDMLNDTTEITVQKGSSKSDVVAAIDYDIDKVESISYSMNQLNLNEVGDYPISMIITVSPEVARQYVGNVSFSDNEDDSAVTLSTEYIVHVVE